MDIGASVNLSSPQPYLVPGTNMGAVAAGYVPPTTAGSKHASASAVPLGEVFAGTIMAKLADDTLVPAGMVETTGVMTASNAVPVGTVNQACFRPGEEVDLVAGAAQAKVLAAGAGGATLTVKTKVPGLSLAIVVSGTGTTFSVTYDEPTKRITINSATDGGGLPTTTLETAGEALTTQMGAYIDSAVPSLGSAVLAALGATALGYANGEAIATGRQITSIDANAGTCTVDGAAITAPIGSIFLKSKAYKPYGILDVNINTVKPALGGKTALMGETVSVRYDCIVRQRYVIGLSEPMRRALSGAPWTNPKTGALERPAVHGILFRNL